MKKILVILTLVLALVAAYFVNKSFKKIPPPVVTSASPAISPAVTVIPTPQSALALPIAGFKERITKKPFGIYITPQNSPVQPERFTGYHTGDDVEYQDVATDVPVYAVADGTVVLSKIASGYGGVFMIEVILPSDGQKHTVLYGHIRPSTLPAVGTVVKKGDQLALLGTGYSTETDGERRHLHFAVLSGNRLDIRGYVQNKSELSGWLDPLTLY